nr:DUF5686 and carboxypeptidase-like regulatory domain-containing protein [uncultured Pedobacter sp.]
MKIKKTTFFLTFILSVISYACFAQNTVVSGVIKDAKTKETIPFASVFFEGTQIGATSNANGEYKLETPANYTKIIISVVGYQTLHKTVIPKTTQNIDLFITPASQQLKEVSVSSKRNKEKYRNKDNPAVELINNVIAHRDSNKLGATTTTSYQEYEKTIFSISNFSDKLQQKKIFKNYQFMFQKQDSSNIGGKNILPVYISESLSNHYLKSNPDENKTIVLANKSIDFSKYLDNNGVKSGINSIYQKVDIYENNLEIMAKQFLSPIANTAPIFYKYYITDTLKNQKPNLIVLNFEARNPNDLLFDGILYITLDGKYAVKKAKLLISKNVNINFVRALNIDLAFSQDSQQHYFLTKSDVKANFGVLKNSGFGLTGERSVSFKNYQFNKVIPDSIFRGEKVETLADAGLKKDDFWATNRMDTLSKGQAAIYRNMDTLQTIPSFKRTAELASVLGTGYKTYKYFEIGPIETFASFNNVEGARLRVGGRTTPNLSKSYFLENYFAYGFKDEQLKFYVAGTYSINHQSIYKFPQNYITASFLRDTKIPGQDLFYNQEGSFFLSFKRGVNDILLYNDVYQLEYIKEFENHFSYNLSFKKSTESPDGGLVYQTIQNNNAVNIGQLTTSEIALRLRYAPKEKFYQGKTGRVHVFSPYPVFNFNYSKGISGLFGGQYNYSSLSASIDKNFQFSQLGFSYVTLEAGDVLGKAPFPLLTIHQGNQTYANLFNSYNLMNFLEFVSDRYVSLLVEQNFNGFFFNKIPLVKKFHLRELATIKALYGGLRDENNPGLHPNLIQFPLYSNGVSRTYTLGKEPYVEGSIGVGNILKFLRVDLIKRFTYVNNPQISTLGFRVAIHVSL